MIEKWRELPGWIRILVTVGCLFFSWYFAFVGPLLISCVFCVIVIFSGYFSSSKEMVFPVSIGHLLFCGSIASLCNLLPEEWGEGLLGVTVVCWIWGAIWTIRAAKSSKVRDRSKKIKVIPVKAELLGLGEKGTGRLLGAAAGGFLLGGVGAVVGAMGGKKKQIATFYVTYSDGHTATEQVPVNSELYRKYMNLRG